MLIKQVHHELVALDDPLNDANLPLIVVKNVHSVSYLQTLSPVLHLKGRLRDNPSSFKLVARPLVSEAHLYHEYVSILDNEFLQSHV